jgi:hypothetical protein
MLVRVTEELQAVIVGLLGGGLVIRCSFYVASKTEL